MKHKSSHIRLIKCDCISQKRNILMQNYCTSVLYLVYTYMYRKKNTNDYLTLAFLSTHKHTNMKHKSSHRRCLKCDCISQIRNISMQSYCTSVLYLVYTYMYKKENINDYLTLAFLSTHKQYQTHQVQ